VIELVRDGTRQEVPVSLGERRESLIVASLPPSQPEVKLGIDVQDVDAELAEKFKLKDSAGVLIAKVEPGSIAEAEGLRTGDLIKEVNREEVESVTEFTDAVSAAKRGETILLRVLRENRAFYVVLETREK